ncbi:hypothetical protein KC909_02115 [Candidatus Dojkabacteria bacterium]|uniref:Uncharacterized protein n=1 Tax=Candidatus Dojkabacteria bacterium TaxID=2099670 RepID=A0A955L513_9BACT|nr:hypothetical protein [Candidatus Dojkabacteria bacterium]
MMTECEDQESDILNQDIIDDFVGRLVLPANLASDLRLWDKLSFGFHRQLSPATRLQGYQISSWLLAGGASVAEIARELDVTIPTVRSTRNKLAGIIANKAETEDEFAIVRIAQSEARMIDTLASRGVSIYEFPDVEAAHFYQLHCEVPYVSRLYLLEQIGLELGYVNTYHYRIADLALQGATVEETCTDLGIDDHSELSIRSVWYTKETLHRFINDAKQRNILKGRIQSQRRMYDQTSIHEGLQTAGLDFYDYDTIHEADRILHVQDFRRRFPDKGIDELCELVAVCTGMVEPERYHTFYQMLQGVPFRDIVGETGGAPGTPPDQFHYQFLEDHLSDVGVIAYVEENQVVGLLDRLARYGESLYEYPTLREARYCLAGRELRDTLPNIHEDELAQIVMKFLKMRPQSLDSIKLVLAGIKSDDVVPMLNGRTLGQYQKLRKRIYDELLADDQKVQELIMEHQKSDIFIGQSGGYSILYRWNPVRNMWYKIYLSKPNRRQNI